MKLTIEVPDLYLHLAQRLIAEDSERYEVDVMNTQGEPIDDDEEIVARVICQNGFNWEALIDDIEFSSDCPFIRDLLRRAFDNLDDMLLSRTIVELMRQPADVV